MSASSLVETTAKLQGGSECSFHPWLDVFFLCFWDSLPGNMYAKAQNKIAIKTVQSYEHGAVNGHGTAAVVLLLDRRAVR